MKTRQATRLRHRPAFSTWFSWTEKPSSRLENLSSDVRPAVPYAGIPFDSILDRVTGRDPAVTQYVFGDGTIKCPRCMTHLSESTLVEFEPARFDDSDF
jgi:hypothetical protein